MSYNKKYKSMRRLVLAIILLLFLSQATAMTSVGSTVTANGEKLNILQTASGRQYYKIGDILVPVEKLTTQGVIADSVFSGNASNWPNGLVYFVFDSSVSTANRATFVQTIQQWSDASAVQFVQSTGSGNYILVASETSTTQGGSSAVGYQGGEQPLSLARWDSAGILHEMGHALGLIHEHQRADRDTYVSLADLNGIQNACPATYAVNWGIMGNSTILTSYDFASVMHYPHIGGLGCNGVLDDVEIDAIQSQPAGAPQGSQNICTTTSQCNSIMGNGENGNLSDRDKYGMALRYGFRLQLNVSGDGTGTTSVSGNPGSCGTNCFNLAFGQSVTVNASPGPGSLVYIGGACSGRQSCSLTALSNEVVSVRFLKLGALAALSQLVSQPSLVMATSSVASRATHGSAGPFDLSINQAAAVDSNTITVEPRGPEQGNLRHLIFTFSGPVTSVSGVQLAGTATSVLPTGTAGTATFDSNNVIVPLTGVPDRKRLQVTLTDINGIAGANATVSLAYLLGDVTQDRQVTGLDGAITGAKSPSALTSSNFLYNVTLSGSINALDKAVVSANSPKAAE